MTAIPDPTPGRRAVLVIEYEVAPDAPVGAFSDAAYAALKALPEPEGVRRTALAHLAIDAPAEAVLAVIAKDWNSEAPK